MVVEKPYTLMNTFDWEKYIKNSIKYKLITTATTTEIFFALKVANIKPPKAFLDATDIMKLAGGIFRGILVKIIESTRNGSTSK